MLKHLLINICEGADFYQNISDGGRTDNTGYRRNKFRAVLIITGTGCQVHGEGVILPDFVYA